MHRFIVFLFLIYFSCSHRPGQNEYPDQVGDIAPDAALDDPSFELCNEGYVFQYYNFNGVAFEGEKPAIEDHFRSIRGKRYGNESGFVTIRFIVNCKGETGRFRVEQMDANFQTHKLSSGLVDDLLQLTKSLRGWTPAAYEGESCDYYQYLSFKIEDGRLLEILP